MATVEIVRLKTYSAGSAGRVFSKLSISAEPPRQAASLPPRLHGEKEVNALVWRFRKFIEIQSDCSIRFGRNRKIKSGLARLAWTEIGACRRQGSLMKEVEKRLREELARLQAEIHEEKSRSVDLAKGEQFAFLGFDFRRTRSNQGVRRPQHTPRIEKRTALLGKLREIFRRFRSRPVERVIELSNPVLRGWVNYFAVGHSSRCFVLVKS